MRRLFCAVHQKQLYRDARFNLGLRLRVQLSRTTYLRSESPQQHKNNNLIATVRTAPTRVLASQAKVVASRAAAYVQKQFWALVPSCPYAGRLQCRANRLRSEHVKFLSAVWSKSG